VQLLGGENAMKAAYIELVGPPQTIEYGDLPMPTVGRKDILVKVEAVTVNGVDTYIRSGRIKTVSFVEKKIPSAKSGC
jgi:NADPH:quinone reductase-like Zn-dependent oxidoreductase